MSKIIFRHLFVSYLLIFLSVTFALSVIILMMKSHSLLQEIQVMNLEKFFQVFYLLIPKVLYKAIPIGTLLSGLIFFGIQSKNRMLLTLNSFGVKPTAILTPLLIIAFVGMICEFILIDQLSPKAYVKIKKILFEDQAKSILALEKDRFYSKEGLGSFILMDNYLKERFLDTFIMTSNRDVLDGFPWLQDIKNPKAFIRLYEFNYEVNLRIKDNRRDSVFYEYVTGPGEIRVTALSDLSGFKFDFESIRYELKMNADADARYSSELSLRELFELKGIYLDKFLKEFVEICSTLIAVLIAFFVGYALRLSNAYERVLHGMLLYMIHIWLNDIVISSGLEFSIRLGILFFYYALLSIFTVVQLYRVNRLCIL